MSARAVAREGQHFMPTRTIRNQGRQWRARRRRVRRVLFHQSLSRRSPHPGGECLFSLSSKRIHREDAQARKEKIRVMIGKSWQTFAALRAGVNAFGQTGRRRKVSELRRNPHKHRSKEHPSQASLLLQRVNLKETDLKRPSAFKPTQFSMGKKPLTRCRHESAQRHHRGAGPAQPPAVPPRQNPARDILPNTSAKIAYHAPAFSRAPGAAMAGFDALRVNQSQG